MGFLALAAIAGATSAFTTARPNADTYRVTDSDEDTYTVEPMPSGHFCEEDLLQPTCSILYDGIAPTTVNKSDTKILHVTNGIYN